MTAYEPGTRVRVGRSGEPGTVAQAIPVIVDRAERLWPVDMDAGYRIYCGVRTLKLLEEDDTNVRSDP